MTRQDDGTIFFFVGESRGKGDDMKSLSRRSVAIVPAVAEPPPWERCPAKSDPFKTIRRHALECGGVFEALRTDFFRAPEELIPPAALLFALGHDAGKISPGFLWKIAAEFARRNGVPKTVEYQRHEVISEAAFFEFLNHRSDRSETIVGWHHGRRNPAPLREGAADYGGEAWQMRRREFLQWASGYASTLPEKLSPESQLFIAGALCLADWIASDEHHFAEDRSARPFEELIADADKVLGEIGFSRPEFRPGMRFEEIFPPYSPNQAQIALAEQAVAPGIFLLETTMGSGKTEAALYAAYRLIATGVNRGFFFALPTRLTSNKIHERVNAFLARVSLSGKARLIHGTAWLEPAGGGELGAGESWFAPAKRAILEPFGVGTVDQVLKGVLNVKHFFLRLAGLAGKVVIIDEVHAFDEYINYLLTHLCRTLVKLNCTVILLSATLTEKRRAELLGLAEEVFSRGYPSLTACRSGGAVEETVLASSWKKQVRITALTPEEVVAKAVNSAGQGCNVAVIANTVGEAHELFGRIRSETESGRFPIGLLHSRFPLWRRNEIEHFWLEALGRDAGEKRPRGSVLVSTQIIEQSVDMDFDLMISETAPGDLLFQRLGRLWRHERTSRPNGEPEFCRIDRNLGSGASVKEVLLLAGGSGRVYPPFLLFRAEEIWRKLSRLTLPDDMRRLLEENFRPPTGENRVESELYEQMKREAETQINRAQTASQLNLVACSSASASDGEDAPTRLADCPQRQLLLLRSCRECGRRCELILSDGTTLSLGAEEPFSLEKMRLLAANTVPVPAWWLNDVEETLPQSLAIYWKFDPPVPVLIGLAGELSLPDGRTPGIRYDDENGVGREPYERGKIPCIGDKQLSE